MVYLFVLREERRKQIVPNVEGLFVMRKIRSNEMDDIKARYDLLHSQLGNFARIAQSTGISRAHVSRVLRGRSGVTLECLKRISAACDVGLDDIVWYIDERRRLEHESKSIQQEVRSNHT